MINNRPRALKGNEVICGLFTSKKETNDRDKWRLAGSQTRYDTNKIDPFKRKPKDLEN